MSLKEILTKALKEIETIPCDPKYPDQFYRKRSLEDLLNKALKCHSDMSESVKSMSDRLEQMHDKLYSKRGKPKSKLVNPRKTKIPGFSYHFSKK